MRRITSLLVAASAVAVISLFNAPVAKAQQADPHVFHMNIAYSITGLDSAQRAERGAILREYHEKVTLKNELILHVWTMTHFFSEDSREFVTVSEYASMADIEKAGDRDSELEKLAWPDPVQRAAFMKKMSAYFPTHKDGIYSAMPKLMK